MVPVSWIFFMPFASSCGELKNDQFALSVTKGDRFCNTMVISFKSECLVAHYGVMDCFVFLLRFSSLSLWSQRTGCPYHHLLCNEDLSSKEDAIENTINLEMALRVTIGQSQLD